MALKMKDLIKLTDTSKSTILYYLKEGLLPEPQKPKPNMAYYDDSCVNIIKFIKYLQKNFSYSINEIKTILKNNKFDFNNSFDSLINSLKILGSSKQFSKDEFLKEAKISESELNSYIKRGYISSNLTQKELEIVDILKKAKELNLDFTLFDRYVSTAKELAKIENDIGSKLLEDDKNIHNERYELLFDIILKLKPYIFNSYTVKEHQERIKNA